VTQSGLSVQRACRAVGLSRATYYRPLVDWARRDAPVIAALTTLGVAQQEAVAGVLVYRFATFWLPILPGWLSLQALERMDRI